MSGIILGNMAHITTHTELRNMPSRAMSREDDREDFPGADLEAGRHQFHHSHLCLDAVRSSQNEIHAARIL